MNVYSAHDGGIYKNGEEIQLIGVNWFGLEGSILNLHGQWTGRTIESFVDQMTQLGFNAVRLPVSPESLEPGRRGQGQPKTALDVTHDFLKVAHKAGLHVLLDVHTCSAWRAVTDKPGPGLGSCWNYGKDRWVSDLRKLADLSNQYDNVIGIDLFNEPYGYRWADWAKASLDAANAILAVNPNTLIFVEGVGNESTAGPAGAFWGENLVEAAGGPLDVLKDRLVFSPHVYGPSVAWQGYFGSADFPKNMPAIWDAHFGFLKEKGYTLVFGEFGGRYVGLDKIWQDAFVDYLNSKGFYNFFYWSWNPNSGDTGGILLDDWKRVNQDKINLLKRIRAKAKSSSDSDSKTTPVLEAEPKQANVPLIKGQMYPVKFVGENQIVIG